MEKGGRGAVLVAARHGERQDYVDRDSGSNWIPKTDRPWDPPLSEDGGHDQVRELGRRVARSLRRNGLPPVSAVYSSPLLRCCQTAAGAIAGLEEEEEEEEGRSRRSRPLQIRIEHGLVESMSEKWFRSWSLPGSDGTWGYCPPAPTPDRDGGGGEEAPSPWSVDVDTLHPMARAPVQGLFLTPDEMEERLRATCGTARGPSTEERGGDAASRSSVVDKTYVASLHPIAAPYCWSNFESQRTQLSRVRDLSEKLASLHPGETVLLLAHGSPVTHLFEVLTGRHWSEHGVSGYASFSVYEHLRGLAVEKDGEADVGGGGDEVGRSSVGHTWRQVVVNDNTHVMDESSAEYKSGR